MTALEPVTFTGRHVRLEPHRLEHRAALQMAANDPKLWEVTVRRGHAEFFDAWWDDAQRGMAVRTSLPFVVIAQHDGSVIGSTSLMNIALADDRLEIGSTWYVRSQHGTAVNPECKLLLMTHAFEVMGMKRVEFCVDAINSHSRAAVTKLGAVQEGILRNHRWTETGRRRDTVIFSVIESEWPGVKERLQKRVDQA